MTYALAISLGHNSSAILIQDGVVLAGYEEERFSGVKSDSKFPYQSILELKRRFDLPSDTDSFVGHWFLDAQLPAPNKYWDPDFLRSHFPNGTIDSLNADFTHHDSHLASAMVFAGEEWSDKSYTAVVADGFGSYGECLTIYAVTGQSYSVKHRVFGFEKSLGMLYQYATAFMGMKMHNHEYKMLAYEVHIGEVLDVDQIDRLDHMVKTQASHYLKMFQSNKITNEFDPVTEISALPNVQEKINDMLSKVLVDLGVAEAANSDDRAKRIIISYFVQHVVEAVMVTMVQMYNDRSNLLVVGGLFYNVKLNHLLANSIKGQLCVMPLAGDQGAALGVYQAYHGDLAWPEHLFWGDRNLDPLEFINVPGMVVVTESQAFAEIASYISTHGWVNVVRGAMEFGPRSLCHTATLSLPHQQFAEEINFANDRTAEMPMAPVMTLDQARESFYDIDKIHKSAEYMIVARQYQAGVGSQLSGAAHWYPKEKVFTGRPQITRDPLMVSLLEEFGPLINTSFNYHGVPIVRSPEQIIDTHRKQYERNPKVLTIIVVKD